MSKMLLFLMAALTLGANTDIKNKIVIDLGEHETGETVIHSISILKASDFSPPYRIIAKSCKCLDTKLSNDPNGSFAKGSWGLCVWVSCRLSSAHRSPSCQTWHHHSGSRSGSDQIPGMIP